jgi:hypothetical protein
MHDGVTLWTVENERVKAVLLKLARGHASYDYNLPQLREPDSLHFKPLFKMTEAERSRFEEHDDQTEQMLASWPEVGSRALQRLLIVDSQVFRENGLKSKKIIIDSE